MMNAAHHHRAIETRPVLPSDTAFARDVHHQAYREVVERQYGRWIESEQDAFFAHSWAEAVFEIVMCDGVPCGYVCVEQREGDVHVRELALLPAFQGQGVGSALMRGVIENARQRQVPVRLRTNRQNRAITFYRRLGFQEIGRTASHILLEWNDTQTES